MNKFFIFLFLIIVLTGFVSAVPPVTTLSNPDNLQILTYNFDTYRQSKNIDFQFHVFNDSKLLTNTSIICGLHLSYNEDVNHIFTIKSIPYIDGIMGDFETELNGNNFTRMGTYCGITECNSSSQTGAKSFCFDITADGKPIKIFYQQYYLLIFAFVFILFGKIIKLNSSIILGGATMTVFGVITLYPGFGYNNYSTLQGLTFGVISIAAGFLFMILPSFEKEEKYEEIEIDGD